MKTKNKKKIKKKASRKKRIKAKRRKNRHNKSLDLQKIIDFKFHTISKAYENFKEKQSFPFDLISDPEEKICKLFDVIKEKSMYGRKYMGIERSTFLIGENGKLVKEWRKVRVPDHAKEVLQTIKAMT